MNKLISVSTKKGDQGESFLINGKKLSKSNLIFDVLGTLDELNSHLGLIVVEMSENNLKEVRAEVDFLLKIQHKLFFIGAQLAESKKETLRETSLISLEEKADFLQHQLAENWTTRFILPGGTLIGAQLDIARTVTRRLERLIVHLSKNKRVSSIILKYINRLSDYLFILRCFVNDKLGVKEKSFKSIK